MKINEIYIAGYGPLHNIGPLSLSNFTLIFGENESGKTMLLDALIKLLLKKAKERRLFSGIDRVEQDPKGYVDIRMQKATIRFPDDGNLADLLEIHPQDLRNVFVVRVSDLELPEEGEYYSKITDRLAGIHREPILQIRKQLKQIGWLTNDTSGAKLSDGVEFGKLHSRVEAGKELLTQIKVFLEGCEENQLLALETEQIELQEKIEAFKRELEKLEAAEKREQYQNGRTALDQLGQITIELATLSEIGEADLEQWRDANKTIEVAQATLKERRDLLDQQLLTMGGIESRLNEVKKALEKESTRQEGARRLLEDIDEQKRRIVRSRERAPLRTVMGNLSIGLFIILLTLLASIFFTNILDILGILAIATGLAFIAVVIWLIVDRMWLGEIEGSWEKLRFEAARHNFCEDSLDALVGTLGEYDRNLHVLERQRNEVDKDLQIIKSKVESTQADIKRINHEIVESQEIIYQIRSRINLASIEILRAALDKKKQLESDRDRLLFVLAEKFGKTSGTLEEKQDLWKSRIAGFSGFSETASDVEYDKSRQEMMKQELSEIDDRVDEIGRKLIQMREAIREIASEGNRILSTDESLPGDTVQDVEEIRRRIADFISKIGEVTGLALQAISIFETIEEEEAKKVSELFGHNDKTSKFFTEITGGVYTQVEYDLDEQELVVQRLNGEKLLAHQLSSGTYDQLYLATRLSLASRILQDEVGFFLLDDPFLTSDKIRLSRQFDILRQLAKEGWQIIYFSVKDEVLGALKPDISRGDVILHRMKPLLLS